MSILAISTAFNPDIDLMKKSIASFINYVDKLLIWRNSIINEEALTDGFDKSKIEFCGDCDNVGIPKALNYAWHYAESFGYSHLLTMDQDSVFDSFPSYIDAVLSPEAPEGFFGPLINKHQSINPAEPIYSYCPFIITSGLFISIPFIRKIGGWDEDFFVDGVDMEFVFHALELGILSYRVNNVSLIHRLGNTETKSFLWKEYTTNNYSPERLYNLYKSHIIIIRKYKSAKALRKVFRVQNYWQRPLRILLGEKDKFKKLGAAIKGIIDGRRYPL